GLGDRETAPPGAFDRGQQVALALRLVGVVQDVVGRAAEAERHERAAQLDLDEGRHDRSDPHAAVLDRGQHAPESGRSCLGLQGAELLCWEPGLAGALAPEYLGLEWHDLALDEGRHPLAYRFLLVAEHQVHHALLAVDLTIAYPG